MGKNTFEISDQARELKKKVYADLRDKEALGHGKIADWAIELADMQDAMAQKLDELTERFVRLEDEVRGGKGAQVRRTVMSSKFLKKKK